MKCRLLALLIVLLPAKLWAHARLLPTGSIPPRSTAAGLKTEPCGDVPKSTSPTVLQKGSNLVVQWEETFQHPGRFELYFSANGVSDWTLLKTVTDTKNGTNDLPHQYSTTITLPNMDCTACAIQLIQVMTETPTNPSNYYSCADIRLQAVAPPPSPAPAPAPAPTPAPSPTPPGCH